MPVRCLSPHATYGCRDSGVCCTSNWPIPIETDRLVAAEGALASRRLRLAAGVPPETVPFVHVTTAPASTPAVVAVESNRCVFYRAGGQERCEIHRSLGHNALPLACRQFPRVSLIDPRGVSITLSHYCPTAASLLETDQPLAIVEDHHAFPPDGEYVGLDVSGGLPPLLRPDMLMDWEAWWELEALSVARLSSAGPPASALADLAAIVEDVRRWDPSDGALIDRVRTAFAASATPEQEADAAVHRVRVEQVLAAIPPELRPSVPERTNGDAKPGPAVCRRFLAAHAFANWTAHLGQGLRTWLRSIEAAHALVETGLGLGAADLLLRHLADTNELARLWSEAEKER